MKALFFVLLLISSQLLHAQSEFPAHCKAIRISKDSLQVPAKKPMLFIIHNKSENDVWLMHPSSGEGAKAGYSTKLASGSWSALAAANKALTLNCIESKPGHEQQLPCRALVAMAKCPKAKIVKKIKSTYWVEENKELQELRSHF